MLQKIKLFIVISLITFTSYANNNIECMEGDCKQYFKIYKQYAKNGSPIAQEILGNFYLNGYGTSKNASKAAKWFKKSAKHGHNGARLALARMYLEGSGVSQDVEKSLSLYKLLADKDISEASFELGMIYGRGEHVALDYVKAEAWLIKSDSVNAKLILAKMYEAGLVNGKQIEKAKALYEETKEYSAFANERLAVINKSNVAEDSNVEIVEVSQKITIKSVKAPPKSDIEVIKVYANMNSFLLQNLSIIKNQGIYNLKSGTGSRIRGKACDKSRGCSSATDPATVSSILSFWSRHQGVVGLTESEGYGT